MADRLSLGGFGFCHQKQGVEVFILAILKRWTRTKLFISYSCPFLPENLEQNCGAVNLEALNIAEGNVQRFRASSATTKLA